MILVLGAFLAFAVIEAVLVYLAVFLPPEPRAWVGSAFMILIAPYLAFRAYRKFFDL